MSRTFRRKNYEDTQGTSWDRGGRKTNGFYTEWDYTDGNRCNWGNRTYRPMTKRERDIEYWRIHGDSNNSYRWHNLPKYARKCIERKHRQYNKRELQKFMLNEEYEPIVMKHHPRDSLFWL